jgi:hypothetical protein
LVTVRRVYARQALLWVARFFVTLDWPLLFLIKRTAESKKAFVIGTV